MFLFTHYEFTLREQIIGNGFSVGLGGKKESWRTVKCYTERFIVTTGSYTAGLDLF